MEISKKIFMFLLASFMLLDFGLLTFDAQANDPEPRSCVLLSHWRVNQTGDTNVRWQANGPNAGSIFINATLFEQGNTLTSAGGFNWHRGQIGGAGNTHNGWSGNNMWAVRTRFMLVSSGIACAY